MKGVTFKPEINSHSVDIFNKSSNSINRVEERLNNYKSEKDEKLIKERTKKIILQHEQFKYHPEIGEKSKILASIVNKNRKDFINKVNSRKEKEDYLSNSNIINSELLDRDYTLNYEEAKQNNSNSNSNNNNNQINAKTNTNNNNILNNKDIKSSVVSESFSNMATKLERSNRSKTPDLNSNNTNNNINNIANLGTNNVNVYSNKSKIAKKTEGIASNNNELNSLHSNKSKSSRNLNTRSKSPLNNSSNNVNANNKIIYVRKMQSSFKKRSDDINVLNQNSKISAATIHNFLYEDSKIQPLKRKQNEQYWDKQIYPFTPHIPQSVRDLSPRIETTNQLIHRLHTSKNVSNELLVGVKKKEIRENSVDRVTGQELYMTK